MRKVLMAVGILLLVMLVAAVFVVPAMDRAAMTGPMIDGVDAVVASDAARLRACFTAGAQFEIGTGATMPADDALDYVEPQLRARAFQGGTARFKGYENLRMLGPDRAEADFVVTTGYAGDETGGHRVPVTVRGHVELTRLRFMRWKISRVRADDVILQTLAPELWEKLQTRRP